MTSAGSKSSHEIKITLMVNGDSNDSSAHNATLDLFSLHAGKESSEVSESLISYSTNFTATAVPRFEEQTGVFVFQ